MSWFICRKGYRRFSRRRYPVLYLHDGQNVFDAATSFAGVEWGADETAERLIRSEIDRADHHRRRCEHRAKIAFTNMRRRAA